MSRRRVMCRALIVFLVAMLSELASAELYEGTLHGPHTKNSDGAWLPEQGIARALLAQSQFVGPADHYAKMAVPGSVSLSQAAFTFYRFSFETERLSVLLGTELAAKHAAGTSHLVCYPLNRDEVKADPRLSELNGRYGVQRELLAWLEGHGWLVIAGHPSSKNDPFDWEVLQGIGAIEVFNDGSLDRDWQTVINWLGLIKKGVVLPVTAGNDSHSPLDLKDSERWRRKTGVKIDGSLSAESLWSAIKEGRTWAERDGIELLQMNIYPALRPQGIHGEVVIQFRLAGSDKISPWVRMYKDGQQVARFRGGRGNDCYDYSWVDPHRTLGKHVYVIVEDGLRFVTSPIVCDIQ